jgi:hypothetical protein
MKKYLKIALDWLIFSSSNPQEVSLTEKAALITALTYGTTLAGFANVQLPNELLTELIGLIVSFVQNLLMFVSIGLGIVGLVRKIVTTFTGNNKVLNDSQV